MKSTKLETQVIENLKEVYGKGTPESIVKELCNDLLSNASQKLKASWRPPPFNPLLLAPFRNIELVEDDQVGENKTILEPISEETFNLYFSRQKTDQRTLRIQAAKDIIFSFFTPAKRLHYERYSENRSESLQKLEELSDIGVFEILMPEEHFKKEINNFGFSPLSLQPLSDLYDLPEDLILKRIAQLAPETGFIAILKFDSEGERENDESILKESNLMMDEILQPLIDKGNKKNRYRIAFALSTKDFKMNIPLNKSMPEDTIFYHSAMFNKPLSGEHLMKLDKKKIKFEVDVSPLAKSEPHKPYPPLLAFFKVAKKLYPH
jgi:hypothetical protein